MHAVVTQVSISDREGAQQALENEVVPRVSGSPGFVAGYWVALGEGKGAAVMVFETEENARAVADQIQPPPQVTFDSIQVGEVAASA
jgi:hypothetical protein